MITREHLTYFHIRLDGCRSYQYFLTKKDHEALLHCLSLWNGISWFSCCSSRTAHHCQPPIENILLYNPLFPWEQSFLLHRKRSFPPTSILRIQGIWLKKAFTSIVEYSAQTEFEFTHAKMLLHCKLVEKWEEGTSSFWSYCTTTVPLSKHWLMDHDGQFANLIRQKLAKGSTIGPQILRASKKKYHENKGNILMALCPPFRRCLTITSCN